MGAIEDGFSGVVVERSKADKPLFPLGQCVMTCGIDTLCKTEGFNPLPYITRHVSGDFGDLCEEDKQLNFDGITEEGRILSAYETAHGKIWIITEWDRSVTTVLLPDEY